MTADQWFDLRIGSGLACFVATLVIGRDHPASMALAVTYAIGIAISIFWEHFGW